MNRDKTDTTTQSLEALTNFRGIFKRVASQLDVDPSYVSRVARGERHAPYVSEALRKEIQRVLGKAGLHDGDGRIHDGVGRNHDGDGRIHDGVGRNHDGVGRNHDGVGRNHEQMQGLGPASLDGYTLDGSADGARHAVDGNHRPKAAKRKKAKKKKLASSAHTRKS
jgi:hypothetical protein